MPCLASHQSRTGARNDLVGSHGTVMDCLYMLTFTFPPM